MNVSKELKAIFRTNDYMACIEYFNAHLSPANASEESLSIYAASLCELGRYDDALCVLSRVFRQRLTSVGDYRRLYRCANLARLNGARRKALWDACNDPASIAFSRSHDALKAGDYDESATCFLEGLHHLPLGEDTKAALRECHRTFFEDSSGAISDSDVGPLPSNCKFVFICGTGWSGSGAMSDYLKEFTGVVHGEGEAPFIARGRYSLKNIHEHLHNDDELLYILFGFFLESLIGFIKIEDAFSYKAMQWGRKNLFRAGNSEYVQDVLRYCRIAAFLARAHKEDRSLIFNTLTSFIIFKFSVGFRVNDGDVIVFDNTVPVSLIEVSQLISDGYFYCFFRDPRSNYVALLRENRSFDMSCDGYIAWQKSRLEKMSRKCDAYVRGPHSQRENETGLFSIDQKANQRTAVLRKVQFEQFVLSDRFRKTICAELGLDVRAQRRFSYFRPWESIRNAMLHEEYENPDEIKKIEESLAQYCYEPSAVNLAETKERISRPRSASSFFNRAFSASSCFKRRTSPA